MKPLLIVVVILLTFAAQGQPIRRNYYTTNAEPVDQTTLANVGVPQVIWYTGGTADWEDLSSAQVMMLAHKQGKINLRAIVCGIGGWRALSGTNYINDASIEAVASVMNFYQVSPAEVQLGLYTNSTWGFLAIYTNLVTNASYTIRTPKYTAWHVTNKAFGKFTSNPYYDTSLRVFRRTLAEAETNSIHFAINHPIAPVTQLLDSPADEFSPLTGEQLFLSRVRQVSIMAGDYPTNHVLNGEYNISTSTGTSFSNVVYRIQSKPITWIGFSIGRTPSASEPNHIKSHSRGWRLLSTANPLYDLTYQATQTGDAGRSAWGGVHALVVIYGRNVYDTTTNIPYTWYSNVSLTNTMVLRTNDPGGDLDIMTYLGIPTTANYTNVGVVQNVQNVTEDMFGFHILGTNKIFASGYNGWYDDGTNHGERYLSYINTNLAQRLLDGYQYNTDFDPKPEKFDNSRTINLGIGTASPEDRVHIQMTNSQVVFRSDNNYAKIRYGLNGTTYAEIASQGVDNLFSSGTSSEGKFEFYQGPFAGGAANYRFGMTTNGGFWVGPTGATNNIADRAGRGEIHAWSNIQAYAFITTNHGVGNSVSINESNVYVNGVAQFPVSGVNLSNLNASALTSGRIPVDVMPYQFRSSVNSSNLDWRVDQISATVGASWTITNAPGGIGLPGAYHQVRFVITNVVDSYLTGFTDVPIIWDQENSRVSQTIIFPPTNVSYLRFWTDGVTNIHAMWETFEPARTVLANAYRLVTNSWAGPTNILYMTNEVQYYVASGNIAVTNLFETGAQDTRFVNLIISNSSASVITGFVTHANAKAIGTGTTNALTIPAAKVGDFWFRTFARYRTNYVTAVEQ